MHNLTEVALDALKGGHSLQKNVRDYFNARGTSGGVINDVADCVSEFRRHAEAYINEGTTDEDVSIRRKVANNICNDVSRICREMTGFSIKCTSRKNHTYSPEVYTPRETAKPSASEAMEDADRHVTEAKVIAEWSKNYPCTVLQSVLDIQGAEATGKYLVQLIEEMKPDEDDPF